MIAFTVLGVTVTWLQVFSLVSTAIALPYNIEKAEAFALGSKSVPVAFTLRPQRKATRIEQRRMWDKATGVF